MLFTCPHFHLSSNSSVCLFPSLYSCIYILFLLFFSIFYYCIRSQTFTTKHLLLIDSVDSVTADQVSLRFWGCCAASHHWWLHFNLHLQSSGSSSHTQCWTWKIIASVSSCAYPLHWNGLALPSLLLCTSFHLFVSLSHRKPLLSIWSSSQISLFLKFGYPSTVLLCSHYLPLNPFQCLSIHCYIHTPLAISSLTDLESSTVLQSPSVPVVVITDWCWSAWNSINRQQGIPKPSNV